MADENEDQWLYGDAIESKNSNENEGESKYPNEAIVNPSNSELSGSSDIPNTIINEEDCTIASEEVDAQNNSLIKKPENELLNLTGELSPKAVANGTKDLNDSNETDSDSDDNVQIWIGDIKSTPTGTYSSLNIKRTGLLTTSGSDNLKKQTGKFSIDDFETIGVINGIQAHEYNLDQIEDKPWRQPGADITDYFNYGFNEETWRAYCERQKRMRSESGVALVLNAGSIGSHGQSSSRIPQVSITNDNSKYSGIMGPKRAGPPPGRKMAGTIDVIGSSGLASRRNLDKSPPKENIIQVMTADRREYSRKPGFPDMTVPPPAAGLLPTFDMPPPGYHSNDQPPFYLPEPDSYYQSYEPTQDSQWGNDPTWQPTNLSIPLTHNEEDKNIGPKSIPTMVPPLAIPPLITPQLREQRSDSSVRGIIERERNDRDIESTVRERERDRERGERDKESALRDRERDRDSLPKDEEKDRERDRSRSSQYRHKESRHRHRSRSRSRRHKSRSRSPSRRKKKSRRLDRERSKEDSE